LPGSPCCMTCYAHIGQHASCSYEWYWTTRPAKPDEYADLLAELQGIYDDLVVCRRITSKMRDELRQAERAA